MDYGNFIDNFSVVNKYCLNAWQLYFLDGIKSDPTSPDLTLPLGHYLIASVGGIGLIFNVCVRKTSIYTGRSRKLVQA